MRCDAIKVEGISPEKKKKNVKNYRENHQKEESMKGGEKNETLNMGTIKIQKMKHRTKLYLKKTFDCVF